MKVASKCKWKKLTMIGISQQCRIELLLGCAQRLLAHEQLLPSGVLLLLFGALAPSLPVKSRRHSMSRTRLAPKQQNSLPFCRPTPSFSNCRNTFRSSFSSLKCTFGCYWERLMRYSSFFCVLEVYKKKEKKKAN